MSNYCSYHCKTCGAFTVSDINHGDHILRDVAKAAPYIKAALEAEREYLDINISAHSGDFIPFLVEHYGHELEIHGEYGPPEPIVFEKKREDAKSTEGTTENRHWRVDVLYDCSLHTRVTYEGNDYQAMLATVGDMCLTVTVDKVFVWRDGEKYRHIEVR